VWIASLSTGVPYTFAVVVEGSVVTLLVSGTAVISYDYGTGSHSDVVGASSAMRMAWAARASRR
jgi:hypothetical protein